MPSVKPSEQPGIPYTFGPLYDLLAARFPGHRGKLNIFDVQGFARDLGVSNETVYKALRQKKPLSLKVALRILEFSREHPDAETIYWEDLIPFAIPAYETYRRDPDDDFSDLLG